MEERKRVFHLLRSFLETWKLSPVSAQILYEVYSYPEHHVDIKTIRRKLPPNFKSTNIEEAIESLVNRPIPLLSPYLRKPEDCYLCARMGRFAASEMESKDLVDHLVSFSDMESEFAERERRVCLDVWGLTKENTRNCSGSLGRIQLHYSCEPSTTPYRDGTFCWRIVAKLKCPRCSSDLQFESDVNPENGVTHYTKIECGSCSLRLRIQKALFQYYVE